MPDVPKKNVLLVSFDDLLSYWHYRKAFNTPIHVPNLDRLCDQATVFRHAYAQAPICGPSRASFMSGKSPPQTGIYANDISAFDVVPKEDFWPVRLKDDGYFNSACGKVHHMYRPLRRRYHKHLYSDNQKWFTPDMHFPEDTEKRRYGGHRAGWAATDPKDDPKFYDWNIATSTIDFLQGYDGDAPFYRECGFYSPHGPFYTPARFRELYDVDAFTQPECWKNGFPDEPFIRTRVPPNPNLEQGQTDWWRASLRNYFSALSHGDYHLGRVLDALAASDHAKSTLVVVVADHGFHLGDRNRFSKFTLFEQSVSVPMIIYDPARPVGQAVDDPVALLDVGPTLLDYAGLPAPANCAGQSLMPFLDGARDPDRPVPSFSEDGVTIRWGDYRLIRYHDRSVQLFDISEDLWQQRDLGASHPAFDGMMAALRDVSSAHGLDIDAIPIPE